VLHYTASNEKIMKSQSNGRQVNTPFKKMTTHMQQAHYYFKKHLKVLLISTGVLYIWRRVGYF
jgi:hypothetical protein